MLDGFKINGIKGLTTIAFCEAQIAYMIEHGVDRHHTIIDEYEKQIELERGRL